MPPKKDKQVGGLIDPSGMTLTLMKASPSYRLSDASQVYESKNYMNMNTAITTVTGGSRNSPVGRKTKTVNPNPKGKKTDKKTDKKNKGNK